MMNSEPFHHQVYFVTDSEQYINTVFKSVFDGKSNSSQTFDTLGQNFFTVPRKLEDFDVEWFCWIVNAREEYQRHIPMYTRMARHIVLLFEDVKYYNKDKIRNLIRLIIQSKYINREWKKYFKENPNYMSLIIVLPNINYKPLIVKLIEDEQSKFTEIEVDLHIVLKENDFGKKIFDEELVNTWNKHLKQNDLTERDNILKDRKSCHHGYLYDIAVKNYLNSVMCPVCTKIFRPKS